MYGSKKKGAGKMSGKKMPKKGTKKMSGRVPSGTNLRKQPK